MGALTAVSKEIKVHPSDILGVNFSCLPVVQCSEKKHTLEARTQVGTRHHWKLPLTGDRRPPLSPGSVAWITPGARAAASIA